jgi:diacylglycerol kinase family enzyme
VLFLGASAAGAALLHAPRQTPAPGSPKLARRSHHGALFINPKSGGGTAERVNLAEEARRRGIDATVLSKDDDLLELARNAVRDGADCLGAAGGDGTLALVAEVAIESGLPFVCIPAGTRNHFALDLGLDREDPLGALDAFGEAVERAIDVGDVSGHMFLNNVSIGAYGEIVANDAYRDNKVGTAPLKLPDGNGVERSSALVIHVSNNSYVLTPRPGFGTRPSLCDGELGVAVVVGGVHGAPIKIEHWQAPTFSLTSGGLVAAGLDGEAMEFPSPLEFSIRPGVLRARTAMNAPGVSPAAKAPPLSVVTVRRLAALSVGHVPA